MSAPVNSGGAVRGSGYARYVTEENRTEETSDPANAPEDLAGRRLLLVHAHPDDETIGTGATMARYAAEGAAVTLVTCTLGEEGEILVPDLVHLGSAEEDRLAEHRLGELQAAMAALGVSDHLRLGGDYRFRDSGMIYDEQGMATAGDTLHDDCFWRADLLVAADELVPVIRSRKPQVLITYDQFGGSGHPDHVQAHRVATYAAQLAGTSSYRPDLGEAWVTPRVLWSAMSASWMRKAIRALREAGDTESWGGMDPDGEMPPMVIEDEAIDVQVDGADVIEQKRTAMKSYPTQIDPDSAFFATFERMGTDAWRHEHFRLAAGVPFPGDGWADDIFAGL